MTKKEIRTRLAELEEQIDEAETEKNMWEQRKYKLDREKENLEELLNETK